LLQAKFKTNGNVEFKFESEQYKTSWSDGVQHYGKTKVFKGVVITEKQEDI